MSIQFDCPKCSQHLSAADSAAGQQTRCPTCGSPCAIPAATLAVPVEAVPVAVQFCPRCGQQNQDASLHCVRCGHSLHGTGAPAACATGTARPASVTTFGVLSIVFASLGILGTLIGLVALPAAAEEMRMREGQMAWSILTSMVGLGFVIWLLTLGIGLLNLRRWARVNAIAYAWCSMGLWLVNFIVTIGVFTPEMDEDAAPFIILGMIIGSAIALAYPILLLVFMNRKPAVDACNR